MHPSSDLHAVPGRGLLTGNRGCLVDDDGRLVRHHRGRAWISCVLERRGWRQPLAAPHRWTPLFLLDDAAALAAGHRPCARCRREQHLAYRDAVTRGLGLDRALPAAELDARLAAERLRRGRGSDRADHRITWTAAARDLPDGTVVLVDARPRLLLGGRSWTFTFDGWRDSGSRLTGTVTVLTPPTSVLALANGFTPLLHPSTR